MLIDKKMILPPGEVLDDMMELESVSPVKLSEKTGIPLSCVQGILAAEHAITPDAAQKLERGFYGTAESWLKMQRWYEEAHNPAMSKTCAAC